MLQPPEISEDRVVATVALHHGLRLTALAFLPLGQDVAAWAYRAETADGANYFLKLRQGPVNEAALRVPRWLADHGVLHAVAPVPGDGGRLWVGVDRFMLTLYPFIEGSTAMAHGLQECHWVPYGAALRAIHDTPLAPDLTRHVAREAFASPWTDVVSELDARMATRGFADPIERELAAFWRGKRAQILTLVERLGMLGRLLRSGRPPLVLCHADVHPNNVLIDTNDRLWIVDWDDTLLAPKECDLMFGIGGLGNYPAGPREQAWFLHGYGETAIDSLALPYYRCLRAVGDIAYCGKQVLLMPAAGEATRRNALQRMMRLFEPGFIVSLAREPERLGA